MNQSRKEGKAVKKYFHILLIIALVGVAIVAEAQGSGDLRNAVGAYIGQVDRDGNIRNATGTSIGKVDKDGIIRNSTGTARGQIDKDGTIRNSTGTSIEKVDSDGTVRNSVGTSIGKQDATLMNYSKLQLLLSNLLKAKVDIVDIEVLNLPENSKLAAEANRDMILI